MTFTDLQCQARKKSNSRPIEKDFENFDCNKFETCNNHEPPLFEKMFDGYEKRVNGIVIMSLVKIHPTFDTINLPQRNHLSISVIFHKNYRGC